KWRGGCPWHKSDSGTSFVVSIDSLLWYCAGCNVGGAPLQYLWKLQGGGGVTPRGEDLWALYRKLCDLAGVQPLEKKLSEEGVKQEARRAVLQSTYGYCQGVLWSGRGEQARRYLHTRGFSDDDMNNLALGLYWSARQVKEALLTSGHTQEAIKDAGAE